MFTGIGAGVLRHQIAIIAGFFDAQGGRHRSGRHDMRLGSDLFDYCCHRHIVRSRGLRLADHCDESVAAAGRDALIGASIAARRCRHRGLLVRPNDAIPATSSGTTVEAGVGLDLVTIVAKLTFLDIAITARTRDAVSRHLSGLHCHRHSPRRAEHAVATAGFFAVVTACVVIVFVPVIASLLLTARLQIRS